MCNIITLHRQDVYSMDQIWKWNNTIYELNESKLSVNQIWFYVLKRKYRHSDTLVYINYNKTSDHLYKKPTN